MLTFNMPINAPNPFTFKITMITFIHFEKVDGNVPLYLTYVDFVTIRYITTRYDPLQFVTTCYTSSQLVTLRLVAIRYDSLRLVTLRYNSLQFVTLRLVTIRYDSLRLVTFRYISLHFVTFCYDSSETVTKPT